jgi:hypothetical protein
VAGTPVAFPAGPFGPPFTLAPSRVPTRLWFHPFDTNTPFTADPAAGALAAAGLSPVPLDL